MLAMNGFEAAERHVGIDLGGRDIRVTKERLDAAQIGPMLDHMRGAAVPKHVRAGLGGRG